jgi:acyl-coenzyme A thioesterase PaaI-like protein
MNASVVPPVLRHYRSLSQWPGGRWLFARIVAFSAPYFASIAPRFHELRPGFCQVSLRKRRAVLNHIGTVHAIAMANLCELACGMLMEVTIPVSMRWIPRGMTIEYLRKAETDVTGTVRLDKTDWGAAEDVGLPVSITDRHGTEVVRAVITMYVSPRKKDAR